MKETINSAQEFIAIILLSMAQTYANSGGFNDEIASKQFLNDLLDKLVTHKAVFKA